MRGHIRKRGNKWAVIVDVGLDQNGQRKQRWHSGFDTKGAASRALTEILGRVLAGAYVEPSKVSLSSFMREWLEAARVSLRLSTWQSYRTNVEAYVIPRLGTTPLQAVTPAMLNNLYADLLASGRARQPGPLSARTVRYTHTIIRKALATAVQWDRLTRNPAEQATAPRHHTPKMTCWTAEELRTFLKHVEDDRLYAAWVLAATTGLRRGELLGLRWQDVDLDALPHGRIAITQALLAVRNRLSFSEPKTRSSRRSVALDQWTQQALQVHRACQREERMETGIRANNDLVFTREDGEPLHPDLFSRDAFQRHARAAGLPRIRFHDLRHSYATLALQAGVPAKVVSDRLGHSTISITLDTYSHVLPGLQEDAAEKVAALVFG